MVQTQLSTLTALTARLLREWGTLRGASLCTTRPGTRAAPVRPKRGPFLPFRELPLCALQMPPPPTQPPGPTPGPLPLLRWRFVQRLASATISAFSTQQMLYAIGLGARARLQRSFPDNCKQLHRHAIAFLLRSGRPCFYARAGRILSLSRICGRESPHFTTTTQPTAPAPTQAPPGCYPPPPRSTGS